MITASNSLKTVFYNNTNIRIDSGCTIEYNMNTMSIMIVVPRHRHLHQT